MSVKKVLSLLPFVVVCQLCADSALLAELRSERDTMEKDPAVCVFDRINAGGIRKPVGIEILK